jgi:hypothetical protein
MQLQHDGDYLERENEKNSKITFVGIILILVVVLSLAYFVLFYKPTAAMPTTTIQIHRALNFSLSPGEAWNLLERYPIPGLNFYGTNNGSISMCYINYSGVVYLAPGFNESSPVSDSMNKNIPFVAFTQIQQANPSYLPLALEQLRRYNGYCAKIEPLLIGNSTYSYSIINVSGHAGYLVKFDYLNENAFNITSTTYVGPMPNISYYIVAVPYKNAIVRTVYWGFTGHMNVPQMINITASVLSGLASYLNTSS